MQDGLYIRVKQAIAWLKRNQGILQKDIADRMGMAEASFTRGLARIKEKNDEDFVISFHSAVSDFISLDYLLHGVGSLVTEDEKVGSRSMTVTNQQLPDMSSVINAALAAKDETIATLNGRIADLQRTIADKEEIIKAREARIAELERQLAAAATSDLSRYPFTIGAAEPSQSITKKESR